MRDGAGLRAGQAVAYCSLVASAIAWEQVRSTLVKVCRRPVVGFLTQHRDPPASLRRVHDYIEGAYRLIEHENLRRYFAI